MRKINDFIISELKLYREKVRGSYERNIRSNVLHQFISNHLPTFLVHCSCLVTCETE